AERSRAALYHVRGMVACLSKVISAEPALQARVSSSYVDSLVAYQEKYLSQVRAHPSPNPILACDELFLEQESLSLFLHAAGRYAQAERGFLRAAELYNDRLRLTPGHTNTLYRLAGVHGELARIHRHLGRQAHAIRDQERRQTCLDTMARGAPTEMNRIRVIVSLRELAASRLELGDPVAALRDLRRCLQLLDAPGRTEALTTTQLRGMFTTAMHVGRAFARR